MWRAWLTIYAFSSENWRRPAGEVLDLTGLLRHTCKSEIAELKPNGVRLRFIGDRARFDADIQADLANAERDTADNTRLNLIVALSYGARAEIVAAARALAAAARARRLEPGADRRGRCSPDPWPPPGSPDPDLIIRTSGEQRLSNFLLWQAAYAELVFLDVLWPDFGPQHFAAALTEYRAARAAVRCPPWLSVRLRSRWGDLAVARCCPPSSWRQSPWPASGWAALPSQLS